MTHVLGTDLWWVLQTTSITGLHTRKAYTQTGTSSSQCVHQLCSCLYSWVLNTRNIPPVPAFGSIWVVLWLLFFRSAPSTFPQKTGHLLEPFLGVPSLLRLHSKSARTILALKLSVSTTLPKQTHHFDSKTDHQMFFLLFPYFRWKGGRMLFNNLLKDIQVHWSVDHFDKHVNRFCLISVSWPLPSRLLKKRINNGT